jgi:glucose/arabinose dehydrogenase
MMHRISQVSSPGAWLMALLLPWLLPFFLCGPARAEITVPPNFQDSFVAQQSGVMDLAFTPDGRMLVAEISGAIAVRLEDGTLENSLALNLGGAVCATGDRGIQSVAVDPNFETNHYIYVYYQSNKNGTCADNVYPNGPVSRLSRFVLNDDDTVPLASEVVLVDNIPSMSLHQGGDIAFGKDGDLYVTTGDGECDYAGDSGCQADNDASRDKNILLGKVLRLTAPDGGIPPDNPFTGANSARCNATGGITSNKYCQETYASGLRNPWKFAFDPNAAGTRFFINDVGGGTWEEIDQGQAGADYGWNVREGFCATSSTTNCGPPPPGMTNPIYAYGHVNGCNSITGGAFVPDGLWRAQDNGAYLYADWGCGTIFELTPSSGGGYTSTPLVTGIGTTTLTDMTFGPYQGGEALYYASYNAPYIRRLSYTNPRLGPPLSVSLVPGFKQCGTGANAPNAEHAAPLATASCSPTATAGAAHVGSRANGVARQNPIPGDPSSLENDADLNFLVWQSDVRSGSETGPDYNPSPSDPDLALIERLRISDNSNGTGGTDRATATDLDFSVPVYCTPTIDSRVGSTCTANTTANAVMPGAIVESKQMNIQVFRVHLNDAGVDGIAGNADDTLFEQEGLLIP